MLNRRQLVLLYEADSLKTNVDLAAEAKRESGVQECGHECCSCSPGNSIRNV
jgi:hypothetical protein